LEDSKDDDVIVIAHRGDWRHAPENSLQAIQNCIDMGVEMVEIDVRETKDGQLVLMHDVTIDRTTTGSGKVNDWTLDSLKSLRLLDGLGIPTRHQIPTLEEALELAKGQIMVNLDKSYAIFDRCFKIIEATGTADQIIMKGKKSRKEVEAEFGQYLDKVHFMPIVSLDQPDAESIIEDYMTHRQPIAFEFLVAVDTFDLEPFFQDLRNRGTSVWINALWPNLCAGYDDERAAQNPEIYNWYIEQGVDMIQTDRPALLIEQLAKQGN
ncbi:MAG: glycerophosphodiester phosphodiesterase family protein, partial [Bacteroidota bacterium]